MPIPFILGAAALAAGAFGVKKGLDAKEDMNRAKDINEEAQAIANKAQKSIEKAKDATNEKLVDLGKAKINIETAEVVENNGIKPADLRKAVDAVKQYKEDMIRSWKEYFDED